MSKTLPARSETAPPPPAVTAPAGDGGDLPEGWAETTIGEALTLVNGCPFKPSHWKTSGLPIIRIQNLNNPKSPFNYCDEAMPEKYRVRTDDLLFAWSGTPGTSFGSHIWKGGDAWLNQHIFRVDFDEQMVDRTFLKHAINQNLSRYIVAAHGGAGLAHITKSVFEESTFVVAPLAEQRRIVGVLEGLLGKVAAGRERLARVPQLLKRFRQSVLAAACSGKLTADWREENTDEAIEPRIERLKAERRCRWTIANPGRDVSLYVEPCPPNNDAELFSIPDSWAWIRAEQACDFITKGTTPSAGSMTAGSGEIPFIKVYNLTHHGTLNFSVNPTFVSRETHTSGVMRRSCIRPGDVLMNLVGPPLGKVSLVPSTYPEWNTNQAVAIYRTVSGMAAEFLAMTLLTGPVLEWAMARSKATVGQHNLTLELARNLRIPFPPLAEQHEIVRRVEQLFALADRLEAQLAAARTRVDRLTQSILAKAFRGELVPTEADLARRESRPYEPASELLARIRDQPTTTKPAKAPRKPRQKSGE